MDCVEFSNYLDIALLLYDKRGYLISANSYYSENYSIPELENPKTSLFEMGLLSSNHRERLSNIGSVTLDILCHKETGVILKLFPSKRIVDHYFFKVIIKTILSNGRFEGYILELINNTDVFNNLIDANESKKRWENISILGKLYYWQFDVNTSTYNLSDNFWKLTGKHLDGKVKLGKFEDYLATISEKDRKMLREQWHLTLVEPKVGVVFEYSYDIVMDGEEKSYSCRWTLDQDLRNPVIYGIIIDIGELSKTESSLNETLSHLTLLSGLDDFLLWDFYPQINEFKISKEVSNDYILEDMGLKRLNFTEDQLALRLIPEDVIRVREDFTHVITGVKPSSVIKMRLKNRDGKFITVITNYLIKKRDVKGNPIHVSGVSKFLLNANNGDEGNLMVKQRNTEEKKTILVAEDIDNNFDLINIILRKDYDLIRAVNGVEAVRMYSLRKPDLILMDMKMPEMGGLEATQLIRMESPDVPIIAVTAFAFESDKEKALEAGCNDFISKPIDIPVLKNIIKMYINK